MGPSEREKLRILVVDDEELNREILVDFLSEEYEVESACNGEEALSIIEKDPESFSALLTDLHMPVMDGFQLMERLKQTGLGSNFPIVVLTSDSDLDTEVRCLDLDAIAFIRKPYHLPVVLRHIRNVVELFLYQEHLEEEVQRRLQEIHEQGQMLEHEREISRQMGFEASHDALTGLFNRQAFQNVVATEDFGGQSVALLHIDVDHFKEINDKNGHDLGDEVLRRVATELANGIGARGRVFRMGGDEFLALISPFDENNWDRLCSVLATAHQRIRASVPEGMSVSLSGGVAISERGYDPSLYKLADDALYHTKRKGRAGCTMSDGKGGVAKYWKDGIVETRFVSALEQTRTGSWRIEVPSNGDHPVFFCDETTRMLMGVNESVTPEQVFDIWLANIVDDYRGVVRETRDCFLRSEKAECIYQWNHPSLGVLTMRSGGMAEPYAKGTAFQGYHQVVSGTYLVTKDSVIRY